MLNQYIGLTIGPLYKTLTAVKHTRELWGASYIFSYIMKKIIEKLKNNDVTFIIPYTSDEEIFQPGQEVGLFHDRFLFKARENDFNRLEAIINDVLTDMANKINPAKTNDVFDFMKQYFQLYYCEISLEDDLKQVNEKMNTILDSLELQSTFIKQDKTNYLLDLFDKINASFLIEDAFGKKKRHSFLSIPEIAALREKKDLDWTGINLFLKQNKQKQYDNTNDTELYVKLKEINGEKLKPYHKYIAIVQADGDNLSKTIHSLKNDFEKLSKALLDFSKQAHCTIKDYGGLTIFAGGDDLLFFAPVVSASSSVFDLVHELGDLFERCFDDFDRKPTLSSGISITYYKYPMGEALENAAQLLFNTAKKIKVNNEEVKHAIAFDVQKHSGQKFSGILHKNAPYYEKFLQFIPMATKFSWICSKPYLY
ncbi:MAG: type III-B CRISPR-associated protein Cas10/Cmr2 [Candidatus Magnetomorum sp.]|nr:type III-B CRISPR-associated protein Cas10/Cmr2 [Candidatus Magnetomorum sp.]